MHRFSVNLNLRRKVRLVAFPTEEARSVFSAILLAIFVLLLSGTAGASGRAGQEAAEKPVPLNQTLIDRLPVDYRQKAKELVAYKESLQKRLATFNDDSLIQIVIGGIAEKPEGAAFLRERLEKENSPAIRTYIIEYMGRYWRSGPEAQAILERHAKSDPDAGVSLLALNTLKSIRMAELSKLLEARLQQARTAGDKVGAAKLDNQLVRHYSWFGDMNLPDFLVSPPAPFNVATSGKSIRVLAFGDFGADTPQQRTLAESMVSYNKAHPFDFGITLGDNFYPRGMNGVDDPRWQTTWEQLYGPLNIKFYPTFGNHDYGMPDSPAGEILYSAKSPDWRFPAAYYTYTAGPVQFFAIDNIALTDGELSWLDDELAKSTAPWKVVYGHYHIYSATRGDNKELIERLLPILKKNHVDIYMNGHDHNLQELKPDGALHFFVSGGGGAELYEMNPYDRSVYKKQANGFSVIEATDKKFKISFIGVDGSELYSNSVEK